MLEVPLLQRSRAEVLAHIREETDTVLLAFSRGKDSLAAWVILREAGFHVVPFHMCLVPNLAFVERSLCQFETHFDTPIIRVMHPNFFHWLKTAAFQTPSSCPSLIPAIERGLLPHLTYPQIDKAVGRMVGLEHPWCATGMRAVDSARRAVTVKRFGAIQTTRHSFVPIFDMKKAEQLQVLQRAKIKLPIDYALFGRSFDGIDWRFLAPLYRYLPEDYARIVRWFPLVHLEFARARIAQRLQGGAYAAARSA